MHNAKNEIAVENKQYHEKENVKKMIQLLKKLFISGSGREVTISKGTLKAKWQ